MAKFLEGKERRAEWAESYGGSHGSEMERGDGPNREGGGLYRIWNGMQGEMSVHLHLSLVYR